MLKYLALAGSHEIPTTLATCLGFGRVAFPSRGGGDAVALGDDGGDRAVTVGGRLRELQRELRGGGRLALGWCGRGVVGYSSRMTKIIGWLRNTAFTCFSRRQKNIDVVV